MKSLVVVDCTLRDGGFHCAWDFEPELVRAYLAAVDAAGVDYAEVGYRSLERDGFAGALRYCDEEIIRALPALRTTALGVMVDARELVGREALIDKLFVPAEQSRIALVRVATRAKDLGSALAQAARLDALGYRVGLNIMAWASVADDERAGLVRRVLADPAVDVMYIADSYGSMYPSEIADAGLLLEEASLAHAKPWGVHLHDNLELAFANALAARGAGASWVDASVLGMGRGPGNLKTELWLQHLESRERLTRYRAGPLYPLIGERMERLRQRYGWGTSAPYVLSGQLAVHPSYAQELLESQRYSIDEVTAILHALHQAGSGRSYSRSALDGAISARPSSLPTRQSTRPGMRAMPETRSLAEWRGADWSSREVLIVGRGPSTLAHVDAVNRYIRRMRPIVLECNHQPEVLACEDHVAAFIVAANAQRMGESALAAGKAILLGLSGRSLNDGPDALDGDLFLEPYRVHSGRLDPARGEIPADVVSMFAIAQALRFGARTINVVGFDGYVSPMSASTHRDQRMQDELVAFLALVAQGYPDARLTSLTPTNFPIAQRSIYGVLALHELDA